MPTPPVGNFTPPRERAAQWATTEVYGQTALCANSKKLSDDNLPLCVTLTVVRTANRTAAVVAGPRQAAGNAMPWRGWR